MLFLLNLFSEAGIYRREQWHIPLAAALTDLVECCNRLKLEQVSLLWSVTFLACKITSRESWSHLDRL